MNDNLSKLHEQMADVLLKALKGDLPAASTLDVIRKFLADNHINEDGRRKGSKLGDLADKLPHADPDAQILQARILDSFETP